MSPPAAKAEQSAGIKYESTSSVKKETLAPVMQPSNIKKEPGTQTNASAASGKNSEAISFSSQLPFHLI